MLFGIGFRKSERPQDVVSRGVNQSVDLGLRLIALFFEAGRLSETLKTATPSRPFLRTAECKRFERANLVRGGHGFSFRQFSEGRTLSPALPPCTGSLGLAKRILRDPSEELFLHTCNSIQLNTMPIQLTSTGMM